MEQSIHHPDTSLQRQRRHHRTDISLICCLIFLLSGGTTTFAQTGNDALRFSQRSPAAGVVQAGFAGTGNAGLAGFGALYTNPAGLGYIESSQVTGSIGLLRTGNNIQFDPIVPSGLQHSTQTGNTTEIPHAGIIYKYPSDRGSLVFGAGFSQTATFERSIDYQGDNSAGSITDTFLPPIGSFEVVNGEPVLDYNIQRIAFEAGAFEFFPEKYEEGRYPFMQAVAPETTIRQQENTTVEGRINEIHLGGAWQFSSTMVAGVSLNLSYGNYKNSRSFREEDRYNENIPEMYNVRKNGQTLRGFHRLEIEERISSEVRGINLRTGISAELVPQMKIGMTFETPTVYTISEQSGSRITTGFVEGGDLQSGSPGTFDMDYRLRTPWRFGAGISLDLNNLMFMTDVEYTNWSQLEFRSGESSFDTANHQLRTDVNATFNWRGGIEWPLSFAIFRGGMAWYPDPRNYSIELPDNETTDRSRTFFTFGASVDIRPHLRFDLSWMQERFADQYRPYDDLDHVPGEVGAGGEPVSMIAPVVDEKIRRSSFRIWISYSF